MAFRDPVALKLKPARNAGDLDRMHLNLVTVYSKVLAAANAINDLHTLIEDPDKAVEVSEAYKADLGALEALEAAYQTFRSATVALEA